MAEEGVGETTVEDAAGVFDPGGEPMDPNFTGAGGAADDPATVGLATPFTAGVGASAAGFVAGVAPVGLSMDPNAIDAE